MKATVRDLRYRTKECSRPVKRGEVTPLPAEKRTGFVPGKAFGMWKDRKDLEAVSGYVRKLRRSRFQDL